MKKIYASIVMCIIFSGLLGFYQKDNITFHEKEIEIQINEEYDFIKNIKSVTNNITISINKKQLDITSLGSYEVVYTVEEKEYPIVVHVVDKVPPQVQTKSDVFLLDSELSPNQLIESVEDDSFTTVAFLEDYQLDTLGYHTIMLIVEDEYGNQTECSVQIEVVEDKIAPIIESVDPIQSLVYEEIDYMQGIYVTDDYDNNPIIEIDTSQVDINHTGSYEIEYIAKDNQGNTTVLTREVIITSDKTIYLTFDDGPSSNTIDILEILEEYDIQATFFVAGQNSNYFYLIEEAYLAGHSIGVHTYSHSYRTIYESVDAFFEDINKMNEIVYEYTGSYSTILRFPGGSSNTVSKNYSEDIMSILTQEVEEKGFTYFDWNVSSDDANASTVDVEQIIEASTKSSAKNINLLMHDSTSKTTTVEALPTIIEYYLEQGYYFDTLDSDSYTVHHNVQN